MGADLLADKKMPNHVLIKRTFKYVKSELRAIILSFLLIVINVFFTVVSPRIVGYFTDHITSNHLVLSTIFLIAGVTLAIAILSQVIMFIESMMLTKAGQRIIYKLRMEVFSHIESMSQNQFNDMAVGSLVTRVCNYTSQLSQFFTNVLVRVLKNILTVAIIFVWMVILSWQLGLVLVGITLAVFAISFFFSKFVRKVFSKERQQTSELNTYLNESLYGMKIIQIFNQENRFAKKFYDKNNAFFKTRFTITIAFSIYRPLISFIYICSVALVLYFGARLNLTAGTIVSFYMFLSYYFSPIQELADELNQITRAITAIERLFNLLDIIPEVLDKDETRFIRVHLEAEKECKVADISFVEENVKHSFINQEICDINGKPISKDLLITPQGLDLDIDLVTSHLFGRLNINSINSDIKVVKINELFQNENGLEVGKEIEIQAGYEGLKEDNDTIICSFNAPKCSLEISEFKGKIEFRNIWFSYVEGTWVLKDVSFLINPKETAAFVGATGSGKTTILGLIVRNFEAQKGQILIDDIDIRHIKLYSLRKAIGQMLQDVFLFSGTIKENITLFDEDFTDEEIKAAIDYVNATSFVNSLSQGIETKVLEKGEGFSTGQRQLLSFARTVVHKPQIMILDEATANIDTETEVVIQKSLENIKNIGTMLIVAHRLSTIQHSDKIFVLSKGKIIEYGNHQELLKKRGYYYNLYKLQFEEA